MQTEQLVSMYRTEAVSGVRGVKLWLARSTNASAASCYLKQVLGAAIQDSGIFGARLVIGSPTTTSASVTATASAPATTSPAAACDTSFPSCPACDDTVISVDGENEDGDDSTDFYLIQCGITYAGGDIIGEDPLSGVHGPRAFLNCVEDCEDTEGCVDATFQGGELHDTLRLHMLVATDSCIDTCYLESSIGAVVNNTVAWNARLISSF